jgi:hypothetical protein
MGVYGQVRQVSYACCVRSRTSRQSSQRLDPELADRQPQHFLDRHAARWKMSPRQLEPTDIGACA